MVVLLPIQPVQKFAEWVIMWIFVASTLTVSCVTSGSSQPGMQRQGLDPVQPKGQILNRNWATFYAHNLPTLFINFWPFLCSHQHCHETKLEDKTDLQNSCPNRSATQLHASPGPCLCQPPHPLYEKKAGVYNTIYKLQTSEAWVNQFHIHSAMWQSLQSKAEGRTNKWAKCNAKQQSRNEISKLREPFAEW
jgi:hypothetical protein